MKSYEVMGCFDVAVVGGGHAGIEAAVSAAKLGAKVVLFALSLDEIGNLACNPSIGGTAKGHLVREIDALGGCMGIAADATYIQSRMLNKGKGPAVHSLRVQTDRVLYQKYTKSLLEKTENLEIKQAEIIEILTDNAKVCGLKTKLGGIYEAKAVILATGTYLGGKVYVGEYSYFSGPDGTSAATQLVQNLKTLGLQLCRFKTGTPARVHRRSINFSKLQVQPGDDEIFPFSFLTQEKMENKVECYIAFTNEKTHEIIRENLHRSPLYKGDIEGIGPRYCPSIEDKVVRFADKKKHQIFVEPCGLGTEEFYLQGMSSSLPEDVQLKMYRSIIGFENLEITRAAYAIEYDCVNPLQLLPTLEFKFIKGLYGAGQFNGSSGYEEAAAQGLVAGVNAARQTQQKLPQVFTRQQSYIGTLIDDLVTKGTTDPYRMMTSRSEYRLYLRQDNADERLTPLGRELGLVNDQRWEIFLKEKKLIMMEIKRLRKTNFAPEKANVLLESKGLPAINSGCCAADLLKRPELCYKDIAKLVGEDAAINKTLASRIEIEIKYDGYIKRQMLQISAVKKKEEQLIPKEICYENMKGLRLEAREKLEKVRPSSVGQAARVAGVTPSDVEQLVLELTLKMRKNANNSTYE